MVLGDLLASLLKYKVKKRSVKYAINTSALRQITPKQRYVLACKIGIQYPMPVLII